MLFLAITDQGIVTRPFVASSFQDAAAQVKAMFGDADGPVSVAIVIPQLTGTVNPGNPPTLTMTGDSQTQATILSNAAGALAANATYLAVASPTTAQAVAQVKALTQQIDALIRLISGQFDTTT
jgi:hypothetical protein